MVRLSAVPIQLTDSEQAALEKLVRRPSTSQQIVLRAKIILRASTGEGHGEIARGLSITKDTSRRWRQRWLELNNSELSVAERLADAARPGTPAKFSIEQLPHLYALACEPPDKYERPISHWSARELADELVKQSIVESISPRHVARLLDEADLKPYQSGYWLHPPPTRTLRSRSKTLARSTPVQ